jgi:hypothetical protein
VRGPVDERFVALVGTDSLVHLARCGHTRVFGLAAAGRKTLPRPWTPPCGRPCGHMAGQPGTFGPDHPAPSALRFCAMPIAPRYLMDSSAGRNEYFPYGPDINTQRLATCFEIY